VCIGGDAMDKLKTVLLVLVAVCAMTGMILYSRWKAEKEAAVEPEVPKRGVVVGISYAEERPSAVIDEQIVYEGDVMHGVKIIKIYEDEVEFEKDGERWRQKVQEPPNQAWMETGRR